MRKCRYRLIIDEFRAKYPIHGRNGLIRKIELEGLSRDTVYCWIYGSRKTGDDQSFTDHDKASRFAKAVGIPFNKLWDIV